MLLFMTETQLCRRTFALIKRIIFVFLKKLAKMYIFILFFSRLSEIQNGMVYGKPGSQAIILFLKSNLFLKDTESQGLIFAQNYAFMEKLWMNLRLSHRTWINDGVGCHLELKFECSSMYNKNVKQKSHQPESFKHFCSGVHQVLFL